jgi:hypothetical protein
MIRSLRDERRLDLVFEQFWPRLLEHIKPKLAQLRSKPHKARAEKEEIGAILQELLVLSRQQTRSLANPQELSAPNCSP